MEVQTILQQLLFSTVRIVVDNGNGTGGTGTAFMYQHRRGNELFQFLVTNKHVVKGAVSGSFILTAVGDNDQPIIGTPVEYVGTDFEQAWRGHPDPTLDLCILPLNQMFDSAQKAGHPGTYLRSFSNEHLVTPESIDKIDAVEEILFIGYPIGLFDRVNLTPIVRRGITATPIHLDYEGKPKFLIDAAVFPGSSGSPVIICSIAPYVDSSRVLHMGDLRFHLLGIVSDQISRNQLGQLVPMPIPTANGIGVIVPEALNLGIVVKASALAELVEHVIGTEAPKPGEDMAIDDPST
jgi:hypothetical protein